jgi:hypothetical protein
MKSLVLAFDIERSGATNKYDTIAIGASVVDGDLNELDTLFLPAYYPDDTTFEKRCWDEFWSKNKDKLELLKYNGSLDYFERQEEMIEEFQAFRRKWETYAAENNMKLELVADNNVYDGGFINQLIEAYTNDLPIPYTASTKKYSAFWETHSEQRGLLFAIDPTYNKSWGFSNRIAELYNLPKPVKAHDHNPANDAYSIAYDQQVLLGIRNGKFTRN